MFELLTLVHGALSPFVESGVELKCLTDADTTRVLESTLMVSADNPRPFDRK